MTLRTRLACICALHAALPLIGVGLIATLVVPSFWLFRPERILTILQGLRLIAMLSTLVSVPVAIRAYRRGLSELTPAPGARDR